MQKGPVTIWEQARSGLGRLFWVFLAWASFILPSWRISQAQGAGQLLPAKEPPIAEPVRSEPSARERIAAGQKLARVYCGSCHLFPEPDLLDKKTWRGGTLPRMKIRMGLAPEYLDMHREAHLLKATGVFPTLPLCSEEDWRLIHEYYMAAAPEIAPPQDPRGEIRMGLKLFVTERPKFRSPVPSTTLVKINPKSRTMYMGDGESGSFMVVSSDGAPLDSIKIGNVPVSVAETERGLYLTLIGHFAPSEDPRGELVFIEKTEKGFGEAKIVLQKMPRLTHTEFCDLNGDGKTDFVLCVYGNMVGRLAWFENQGGEQYKEHVLIPKPGALRTVVQDFNGDGIRDIAVLMAQDSETFFVLLNDGKGNFSINPVFQKHPLFGHSSFEMVDFDRDGRLDILATNGDNGEYASPLKKYHGIRLYLNKGTNRFEECFFYPLNGAFKAVARDFDQDGDLDIAAISFFPDYEKSPQESFVYLENLGGLKFAASTFREHIFGRWLICDAGDLDGDGDVDIVLGSYIHGPSEVPAKIAETWERIGPSMLILRNKLK